MAICNQGLMRGLRSVMCSQSAQPYESASVCRWCWNSDSCKRSRRSSRCRAALARAFCGGAIKMVVSMAASCPSYSASVPLPGLLQTTAREAVVRTIVLAYHVAAGVTWAGCKDSRGGGVITASDAPT